VQRCLCPRRRSRVGRLNPAPATPPDIRRAVTNRVIEMLERRGVVTTKPEDRDECCGLPRDEDGFCVHRPGHSIYVDPDGTTP
jgi:hypothetical protein